MMRHYIHSFRIFQPQPSRGKKLRILTRSIPHTAGNTSSREDYTTLNRSNKIIHRDYQLVPAGSGSYPQIRLPAVHGSCWFWVLSSNQTFCSPWFLLSLVHAGFGSYPQIRLSAVPGSCWFRVLSSDQIPAVFGSAGSKSQPQSQALNSLATSGLGSQLQSMPLQPLDSIFPTRGSHHQHQD
ncbi:hypothetical protein HID58_002363 [Brassica napus]|uniref:Uncharacterized protein n=1 Tax=Brassica napus TaxID=3708 RepID=A0ABQ8EQ17_BRANA|nr:hypothetical protein HID58_002363 [Brassica napus]